MHVSPSCSESVTYVYVCPFLFEIPKFVFSSERSFNLCCWSLCRQLLTYIHSGVQEFFLQSIFKDLSNLLLLPLIWIFISFFILLENYCSLFIMWNFVSLSIINFVMTAFWGNCTGWLIQVDLFFILKGMHYFI